VQAPHGQQDFAPGQPHPDAPRGGGKARGDALRVKGPAQQQAQSLVQVEAAQPRALGGSARTVAVHHQGQLQVVHLPSDALPAAPVFHVAAAVQFQLPLPLQQGLQLLEGNEPLAVVAQDQVAGVHLPQQPGQRRRGAGAAAVGRAGLHPVLADPGLADELAVGPPLLAHLRPVPEGNGVEQVVVGAVLVLVVGRVQVAQVRRTAAGEGGGFQAADFGGQAIQQLRQAQADGGQDAAQGVPAVPAEALVAGLEHAGGVHVLGGGVQERGQQQVLLDPGARLGGPEPRVHLLQALPDGVDAQRVLAGVEEALHAVVGVLSAARGVVPGHVLLARCLQRVELGQHPRRALPSAEQPPGLRAPRAEVGVVQNVGIWLPVVGQHPVTEPAGQAGHGPGAREGIQEDRPRPGQAAEHLGQERLQGALVADVGDELVLQVGVRRAGHSGVPAGPSLKQKVGALKPGRTPPCGPARPRPAGLPAGSTAASPRWSCGDPAPLPSCAARRSCAAGGRSGRTPWGPAAG
jgi:hypothetical protein